jgi:hypothetical protein
MAEQPRTHWSDPLVIGWVGVLGVLFVVDGLIHDIPYLGFEHGKEYFVGNVRIGDGKTITTSFGLFSVAVALGHYLETYHPKEKR